MWAPSLVQEGWAGVLASVNSWGKQHVGWARCIDQNIAKVVIIFLGYHCQEELQYYSIAKSGIICSIIYIISSTFNSRTGCNCKEEQLYSSSRGTIIEVVY